MTGGDGGNPRMFKLYGLLAETFIHPGIGQAQSAIDLPVAREATTGFPYIAGSSAKGAARDAFRRNWNKGGLDKPTDAENILFGPADTTGKNVGAGALIVSDMNLLTLPVRSLTGACRYVTSPELIYRFYATLQRAGKESRDEVKELNEVAVKLRPDRDQAIVKNGNDPLFLEELRFTAVPKPTEVEKLADCIAALVPATTGFGQALRDRLTILSDDDFAWFAENALPVRMRNALKDDGSKTVEDGALWSEEYLSPDTLMYMLVGTRGRPTKIIPWPPDQTTPQCTAVETFDKLLEADRRYLQVGGNETVGHGWFRVCPYQDGADS